jgi:hypothetical protein
MEGSASLKLLSDIIPTNNNTVGFWSFGKLTPVAVFSHSGADQTYTVPAGVTSLNIKMWGGGGGGGNAGGWNFGFAGGGGGYTTGTLAVTPGQVLTMIVGAGGNPGNVSGSSYSYGGGGANCLSGDCQYGGQGGGRSAIRLANGTELLTAGGGGGGGASRSSIVRQYGGGGGGATAQDGASDEITNARGRGATSGAAGAGGTATNNGAAGTQYQGGAPSNSYGGGGGGGYYGGGGGGYAETNTMGGGGGGSGYIAGAGVSSASTVTADYSTPGNFTDTYNGGSGTGGSTLTKGQAGKIVITPIQTTSGSFEIDSSANTNHAIVSGTTLVEGISGKARYFNGTSDYIAVNNLIGVPYGNAVHSVEAWIKPFSLPAVRQWPILMGNASAGNYHWLWNTNGTLQIGVWSGGTCSVTLAVGAWNYVVSTFNGTTINCYLNGNYISQGAATFNLAGISLKLAQVQIAEAYFKGSLDEVRISNTALSAEEVAERYRFSRDKLVTRTISSADLSGKTSLPFYVASDRLGTFLSATIGESAFANYQPDANTVGLWHLDEQSGSGAYLKDSAGTNHGTPTGTTFTQGKIGAGRNFNGSSYITVPTSTPLDLTSVFTIETWINPTSVAGIQRLATKWSGTFGYFLAFSESGNATPRCLAQGASQGYRDASTTVPINVWTHLACVYSGSAINIYINGILSNGTLTGTVPATLGASGTNLFIGSSNGGASLFIGTIDEVRISNIARTADQIRQAYEVGLRTHLITIDFKANLVTNLIADVNDKGFTVTETPYGATLAAGHLFLGDKIIVKENVDGTEYIAQGTVNAVNTGTGAVTVSAWDAGSTFPTGGYTASATVFKWQREYFDIRGSLSTHRDAITNLTLRVTDGSVGANVWLDDFRSSGGYLTNPSGSTVDSSTGNRYAQYRFISLSYDSLVSSSVTSVTFDYLSALTPPIIGTPPSVGTLPIEPTTNKASNSTTPVIPSRSPVPVPISPSATKPALPPTLSTPEKSPSTPARPSALTPTPPPHIPSPPSRQLHTPPVPPPPR